MLRVEANSLPATLLAVARVLSSSITLVHSANTTNGSFCGVVHFKSPPLPSSVGKKPPDVLLRIKTTSNVCAHASFASTSVVGDSAYVSAHITVKREVTHATTFHFD
ncbi:hypothetical protein ACJJTC_018619 [Scirpophaga incertulas]